MRTFLLFLSRIEYIVYGLAAVGVFFSIRALVQGRLERRNSVFGLEREAALNKQNRALTTILSLLMLSGGVYIVVNIVTPNVLSIPQVEPTPTQPIVLVTQAVTGTETRLLFPTITPTPGLPPVAGATLPPPETPGEACSIQGARITSPIADQTVAGQVVVQGGANILNFAQYKFEVKGASTGDAWVVVGTLNVPVPDPGFLGTWDSTSLSPGDYVLRLVVSRIDGTFPTPCEVPITVASPGAQLGPSPTPNP
jgi:hypothetical protein